MTVSLVTGANRGIGLELSRQLAARGGRVHAVCRKASQELCTLGSEADVVVHDGVDVTDTEAVKRLAASLGDEAIDVLILCAGILRPDHIDEVDFVDVRAQLEVNAIAPLAMTLVLRSRLGSGAKVALITSRMGSMSDNESGGYYGYRMSKAALNAAGVSLARDLARDGVAVIILHPGFVRTGMTGHAGEVDPEASAEGLLARIDALELATSGRFLHANGSEIPF